MGSGVGEGAEWGGAGGEGAEWIGGCWMVVTGLSAQPDVFALFSAGDHVGAEPDRQGSPVITKEGATQLLQCRVGQQEQQQQQQWRR